MFAKNSFALLFFLAVSACDFNDENEKMKNEALPVKKLHESTSGYNSDKELWGDFLSCWMKTKNLNNEIYINRNMDLDISYSRLKERVGGLPKSYLDFKSILAAPYSEKKLKDSVLYGFFSLDDVKFLRDYDGPLLDVYKQYAFDSNDSEYFRYGVDQDDAAGRFSYLENSIVIGKYSSDSFGYILLYPESVTVDGEMEAAILFHSGEFRAPSFAELMRQISYMDLHLKNHVPPYSQDTLKGTCADKLILSDVWWR